jgi:hypothetical protein
MLAQFGVPDTVESRRLLLEDVRPALNRRQYYRNNPAKFNQPALPMPIVVDSASDSDGTYCLFLFLAYTFSVGHRWRSNAEQGLPNNPKKTRIAGKYANQIRIIGE